MKKPQRNPLALVVEERPEFKQALRDAGYCGAELDEDVVKRIAKFLQKNKDYRRNIIGSADDVLKIIVDWVDSEREELTTEGFEKAWGETFQIIHTVASCLFMIGAINGFLAGVMTETETSPGRARKPRAKTPKPTEAKP